MMAPSLICPRSYGSSCLWSSCQELGDALARRFHGKPLNLGLYVRVKCGLHEHTRQLAAVAELFAALIRQEFPGSPFLTMALIHDPHFDLHRDHKNDWLPNLILELKPSQGGGTWIEEPEGRTAIETRDGAILWGTVLSGAYKLSARAIRCSPRLILVAWTPAAWKTVSLDIMSYLETLGFVKPTTQQSERAKLSAWRGASIVQSTLHFRRISPPQTWPLGLLAGTSGVTLECADDEQISSSATQTESP